MVRQEGWRRDLGAKPTVGTVTYRGGTYGVMVQAAGGQTYVHKASGALDVVQARRLRDAVRSAIQARGMAALDLSRWDDENAMDRAD